MSRFAQWIEATLGIGPTAQGRIVTSLVTVFVIFLVRSLALRVVSRRTESVRTRYMWRKTSGYVAVLLIVLVVGRVWLEGLHSVATFLGLLSAGLAIALKDPVTNFAGWLFVMWQRPFALGDRIQVGEYRGDVIDTGVFQFTLMEVGNWVDAEQSTGRVIHVPNFNVLNQVVANYSKGFRYIWDEVPVLITFESNWQRAKGILQDIVSRHTEHLSKEAAKRVQEAARKYLIRYNKLTPIVYTSVRDSGILLTMRFLCEPQRRRGTEQAVWEDILLKFARCDDIDFAYPTRRFFSNKDEGQTGVSNPLRDSDQTATEADTDSG